MTAHESDAELTARFERDAIPLAGQLYRTAWRMTRSRLDAEDLVQDTMMKAYSGFRSYQDGMPLKAWMFRIMYNTWVSNYRKSRCRPMEHLTGEITFWEYSADRPHLARCQSAEAEALEALLDSGIAQALLALPASLRTVVYYADVWSYGYRDIADIMDIPIGTVMSRLHRARRRLRVLLADAACA
jgi:RNA polymerase sigma-70 factor, ECF subfamily